MALQQLRGVAPAHQDDAVAVGGYVQVAHGAHLVPHREALPGAPGAGAVDVVRQRLPGVVQALVGQRPPVRRVETFDGKRSVAGG